MFHEYEFALCFGKNVKSSGTGPRNISLRGGKNSNDNQSNMWSAQIEHIHKIPMLHNYLGQQLFFTSCMMKNCNDFAKLQLKSNQLHLNVARPLSNIM